MNSQGWFLPLVFLATPILIAVLLIFLNQRLTASTDLHVSPPLQRTKLFVVKNKKDSLINVLATTLPQFAVDLSDHKFSNLWTAHAQERDTYISTQVTNLAGTTLKTNTTFDNTKKQLIVTPQAQNNFKPGLYKLNVTVKTFTGQDITITQDFTWGVLAINTDKGIYQPGEQVNIGMAVLGNKGNTKCIANGPVTQDTAKVWVTIISPSGNKENFSTDDGSIIGSKVCAPTSVTDDPDFQTQFMVEETGTYTIHMTAQTTNGKRSIDDYFSVQRDQPQFTIRRTDFPTRIYPYSSYPVEITVTANQDYSGPVSDFVPSSFKITQMSNGGTITKTQNYQQLSWQVNWTKGTTYQLTYEITFPLVSPEFYLVGPLTIGDFTEHREWQIASDAISLVQDTSNVANSGSSVTTTFGSSVATNDLEVLICSETGNTTINTPSSNGGRSWSHPTSLRVTSAPRIQMFYRLARSTETNSYSCNGSGVIAIQLYEYSGVATSGELDGHGTLSASTSCNTNPYQATVSLNATNGNELVISSHVATGFRDINSHTDGFVQEFAFNGSSTGTFTSADQLVTDSGSYSDTATFSGPATRCSAVIASFITPVTLTENGFQFFQNANSANPGSPIGNQNDNLTLPTPHDPFRLRFLVDVDGNQTVSTGSLDFILEYAQAPDNNDCSTLTDDEWNPVTSTTPIAWNVNPSSGGSGTNISSSGNDPTDTSPHNYTTYDENYYESWAGDGSDDLSNLQNSLSNNRAGLWDVSLYDNTDDTQVKTFCLRVVNGDGGGGIDSDLDSYLQYPEVTTFYNEVNIKGGTTIKSGTKIF